MRAEHRTSAVRCSPVAPRAADPIGGRMAQKKKEQRAGFRGRPPFVPAGRRSRPNGATATVAAASVAAFQPAARESALLRANVTAQARPATRKPGGPAGWATPGARPPWSAGAVRDRNTPLGGRRAVGDPAPPATVAESSAAAFEPHAGGQIGDNRNCMWRDALVLLPCL